LIVAALLRNSLRFIATVSLRALFFALAALFCVLFASPAFAFASTAHEFESSFGPDGTEGTHFESPGVLAVDQQTHDVYALDFAGAPA
jgi:hypothetical protein